MLSGWNDFMIIDQIIRIGCTGSLCIAITIFSLLHWCIWRYIIIHNYVDLVIWLVGSHSLLDGAIEYNGKVTLLHPVICLVFQMFLTLTLSIITFGIPHVWGGNRGVVQLRLLKSILPLYLQGHLKVSGSYYRILMYQCCSISCYRLHPLGSGWILPQKFSLYVLLNQAWNRKGAYFFLNLSRILNCKLYFT